MEQYPDADGPHFLFTAVPTLFLAPATPPERGHTASIAARVARFFRGEWDSLFSDALRRRTPLPTRTSRRTPVTTTSGDERRIARCLRLAACNETSRGDVQLWSYADDTYLVGPPDRVLHHFTGVVRRLGGLGLAVQPHKCLVHHTSVILPRDVQAFTDLGIEVARRGLTVTGVPVGTETFVTTSLRDRLERMAGVLPWLPRLRQPQTAARLLSACVSTRPQYLARTVPPSPEVRAIFAAWDARLGATFQQLLVRGSRCGSLAYGGTLRGLPAHSGGAVAGGFMLSSRSPHSPVSPGRAPRDALMVIVDVSVADPQREGNAQFRRMAPTQIGGAAARRVQDKLRHWRPVLQGLQPDPEFYACVVETFGCLSPRMSL
ncbi:hypothetical protein CLOP_g25703 [Closterium sp. NIES-67]|nr:hypothetical protein CLOP_g25703 [Closterium sp. NIES-67]